MKNNYPPPEECDAIDKNKLRKYQCLMYKIKEMLVEKSDNSIQVMFYLLSWNDTIYRTFNEGLRLMWKRKQQDRLAGSLIEYIHKSHLTLILTILRKLYEPPRYKKNKKHHVNSIPTIIEMINDNISLFNRENYVTYDGTPYEKSKEIDWKIIKTIEMRHYIFDKLSGISTPTQRNRNDFVNTSIIKELRKGAVLNGNIKKFVNKFLFHASAKNNRPDTYETYRAMKLSTIQNQIRNAIWSILQIGKIVDQLVLTELAVPQFDQLKGWEFLFTGKIKEELINYWHRRAEWWSKWTKYYWNPEHVFLSIRKKWNDIFA